MVPLAGGPFTLRTNTQNLQTKFARGGARHWHGAASGRPFTHLSLSETTDSGEDYDQDPEPI